MHAGYALLAFAFAVTLLSCSSSATKPSSMTSDPETSICGRFREPLAFWMFRRAAGTADERRVARIRDIERINFITRDGRELGGYKLLVRENPRGYLLVAPGNAMLADQIMDEMQLFRDRGFDVYIYDYRGYGLSGGKSRLAALVSDYRELVAFLNTRPYRRRALYGMSMGGIILLNAVGSTDRYSAMVVDSSPSRISHLGCPDSYDPVNHLPVDGSRLKIISGERDSVVRPAEMAELMQIAKKRGATVVSREEYAHPFQDADLTIRRRRLIEVADFLTQK